MIRFRKLKDLVYTINVNPHVADNMTVSEWFNQPDKINKKENMEKSVWKRILNQGQFIELVVYRGSEEEEHFYETVIENIDNIKL